MRIIERERRRGDGDPVELLVDLTEHRDPPVRANAVGLLADEFVDSGEDPAELIVSTLSTEAPGGPRRSPRVAAARGIRNVSRRDVESIAAYRKRLFEQARISVEDESDAINSVHQ